MNTPTRRGKIARLPLAIREELNLRLLENQTARKICGWLNKLPETIAVCEEFGEQPIDDRNISDWRKGGYQDWLSRRETIEETRELAQWSVKLAKANGGSLAEGAAAILVGQILEVLEAISRVKRDLAENDGEPGKLAEIGEAIGDLTLALSRVRKGDQGAEQLRLNRERVEQTGQALQLEREKFEVLACRKMLEEATRRKADEIANSDLSNADKIAALRRVAFADVDALEKSGDVKIPD